MHTNYSFTVESVKIATELPGFWTDETYRQLLEALEFDGIAGIQAEELRDYCLMALQDKEPSEAARMLLEITLGNRLSAGKKQNASEDMTSERLWEEYPDLSCHEPIFNAQVLLNLAFPDVPNPEINLVTAIIRPRDQASEGNLKAIAASGAIPEPLIVRCLAAASSESAILNRLFEDQIAEGNFPEAEHLVWQVQSEPEAATNDERAGYKISLYSPIRWTESLEETRSTQCTLNA